MRKYIGLSLSFTIKDILLGIVQKEQIAFIVPGFFYDTNWVNTENFERYCTTYWKTFDKEVCRNLVLELSQCHPSGEQYRGHNIARGRYILADGFEWEMLGDDENRLEKL